jgi:hypothetical protein
MRGVEGIIKVSVEEADPIYTVDCGEGWYEKEGQCKQCLKGCTKCDDIFTCRRCDKTTSVLDPTTNLCVPFPVQCLSTQYFDWEN